MMEFLTSWLEIPVLGIVAAGATLILVHDRAKCVAALAVQYSCVAWLLTPIVQLQVVGIKLFAGLLTALVLISTQRTRASLDGSSLTEYETGRSFRAIAYFLIMIASYGIFSSGWLNLPIYNESVLLGAILLSGSGLLQVGIFQQPYSIGLGLITLISGFEILYTGLEPSLAMVALLAAVHVGLALVISYLELIVPPSKTSTGESG
ncbi:MAG: hypothetical protein JXA97_08660 [Anaerolineales bacterium]|nr:hypothetical protein [Anaerolineales bacterium]